MMMMMMIMRSCSNWQRPILIDIRFAGHEALGIVRPSRTEVLIYYGFEDSKKETHHLQ